MTSLTIERQFSASPARVFAFVTQSNHLLTWWGPQGITVQDHALDLSALGPWFAVMQNTDGQQFHVSGQVTHIDPPHSVGFTWAWHDDKGQRGSESHVTFKIAPDANGGTEFNLTHVNLADADVATRLQAGWTSALGKLETLANQ